MMEEKANQNDNKNNSHFVVSANNFGVLGPFFWVFSSINWNGKLVFVNFVGELLINKQLFVTLL